MSKDSPERRQTPRSNDSAVQPRRSGKWLEQDKAPFGQEDRSDTLKPGEGRPDGRARQGGPDYGERPVDQHWNDNIDSHGHGGTLPEAPEVVDEG